MKPRKNKGYKIQSYGRIFDGSERRRKKRIRNTVLFVLAILVLGFVGYSISGPLSNLLKGEKTERPGNNSSSKPSISSQLTSSEITSSETPDKVVDLSELKVAFLSRETAANADALTSFIAKIKPLGYNAVVIELKDEDGNIYFNSQNAMAASVGAVSEKAIQNLPEIIDKLKSENIMPIAQINAFKDKIGTKNAAAKILYTKHEGWSWFDAANGKPWLNPYSSEAQGYITAISCELAELGFENIMVSSIMFPDVNSFVNADFGELEKTVSHADILSQYTASLKAALNAKNAKLLLSYSGAQAQRENNVVYGGADPKTFDCDALVPYLSLESDSGAALSSFIGAVRATHPSVILMPQYTPADSAGVYFTKEQIDAQNSVCAGCSIYICDKNGTYIG